MRELAGNRTVGSTLSTVRRSLSIASAYLAWPLSVACVPFPRARGHEALECAERAPRGY